MNISAKQYIVFLLKPENFKPFEKVRGPITVEPVTRYNIPDVAVIFSSGKVKVFFEKLNLGHVGFLARHKSDVVGYMWRKDYDTQKTIKADGYIPLSGRFSHLHFARVSKEMRGRGLQLFMFTHIIRDAHAKGITRIYTDGEQENIISMRGTVRMGFQEVFRLLVIEAMGRKFPIPYLGDGNILGGKDSPKKIIPGTIRFVYSLLKKQISLKSY